VAVKDDRLRAYNALIDCCDVHMWEVGLAWTPNERWEISVRDKGELLARSSRVDLADAARVCGRALEKSGRLRCTSCGTCTTGSDGTRLDMRWMQDPLAPHEAAVHVWTGASQGPPSGAQAGASAPVRAVRGVERRRAVRDLRGGGKDQAPAQGSRPPFG
jgi:hypothetical protein